ncbi:hypothetical protein cypCar_00033514 [Cyprinus carpio]|nr:hypothetical protein cypCar_00033514 [Cyprinus carpio]
MNGEETFALLTAMFKTPVRPAHSALTFDACLSTNHNTRRLKVQQGLLIDFTSFPQKFIDLLEQCISEQDKENPRFLLQLSSAFDHSPSNLNIVETNAFKHLTHLSLKLLPGSDTDIKKYLATCLSTVKEEKQQLEQKLRKTEEDLTRQLNYAQQIQARLQQQNEQLRQELESSHHRSTQQLQSKVSELETANRELIDKKYKSDSTIRDLKAKLASLEEECQRSKQQVLSLRRENSTLDTECHEKERLVNQLQTRVAVFEQEIKDKEQLVLRTKEVLEATQQQKANGIIKKLQGDLKTLIGKIKVKNTVTVSQEKILQETTEKLQREQRELQDTQQQLRQKEEEVQFNPMSAKHSAADVSPTALSQPSNKENGGPVGLDSKYFERRDDSIPLRGLLPSMHLNRGKPQKLLFPIYS